jgi:tetratricopeptide (TPR) repeat protein
VFEDLAVRILEKPDKYKFRGIVKVPEAEYHPLLTKPEELTKYFIQKKIEAYENNIVFYNRMIEYYHKSQEQRLNENKAKMLPGSTWMGDRECDKAVAQVKRYEEIILAYNAILAVPDISKRMKEHEAEVKKLEGAITETDTLGKRELLDKIDGFKEKIKTLEKALELKKTFVAPTIMEQSDLMYPPGMKFVPPWTAKQASANEVGIDNEFRSGTPVHPEHQ